jgi:tetratricopeptide (TPR) repeat protein
MKFENFHYDLEIKENVYYGDASRYEQQGDIENALKTYIQLLNEDDLWISLFYNVIHKLSIILRKMKEYDCEVKLLEYAIGRIQNTDSNFSELSLLEERLEKSRPKSNLINIRKISH